MADAPLEKTAITLDDLMSLGSDARVEVIDGEIVEMSPSGTLHHVVVSNITHALEVYVRERDTGSVFPDGLIYLMGEPKKHLRDLFVPDVSFVRNEDVPDGWDISKPFPAAPTLSVEVVSPDDDADDLLKKVRKYLAKGTLEVWVVYPDSRELHQYRQTDAEYVRVYKASEQLDAEALFPDLALAMDVIFKLPKWAKRESE